MWLLRIMSFRCGELVGRVSNFVVESHYQMLPPSWKKTNHDKFVKHLMVLWPLFMETLFFFRIPVAKCWNVTVEYWNNSNEM